MSHSAAARSDRLRLLRILGSSRKSGPPVVPKDIARRLSRVSSLAKNVDRFVAPSRALGDDLARRGVPREKIEISDYGFERLPVVERKPSAGPLRVGFVGTLGWHKGVHVLIDALALLPASDFRASIHGILEWHPDYVRRLRHDAAGLPIEFPGGFGPAELPQVLAGLDVLVVPSIWPENSPLVIHEAFQGGLPVVGARIGGIPELVRDGVDGFLYSPFSSRELAAALARLIADRSLLDRFRAALPAVKSIAAEAEEWERRYVRARGPRASA